MTIVSPFVRNLLIQIDKLNVQKKPGTIWVIPSMQTVLEGRRMYGVDCLKISVANGAYFPNFIEKVLIWDKLKSLRRKYAEIRDYNHNQQ
jgi:hypothetical protein